MGIIQVADASSTTSSSLLIPAPSSTDSNAQLYIYSQVTNPTSIAEARQTKHENRSSKKKKKMKPIDEKKETVTFRAVSGDEEGKKRVEKKEVSTHNIDTLKYIEKKLTDKGVQRMDRHPVNGVGIRKPPPKSGHGGKYTWEGPDDLIENELDEVPPAIDEKDPNYVDDDEEEKILMGEKSDVAGLVVGEVEVAKAGEIREGVARVEVDPQLKVD